MNEFDDLLRTAINSCIPADKKNIKDKLVKFSNIENASKYSHILKILNLITDGNKDIKILDFGCGGGVPLTLLQMSGYKNTYGADLNTLNINKIKKQKSLTNLFSFSEKTFSEILNGRTIFDDNFFDIIISNQVLEHVNDFDQYYLELTRVLNKNGKAILIFPHKFKLYDTHSRTFCIHLFPRFIRGILYDIFTKKKKKYFFSLLNLKTPKFHYKLSNMYFNKIKNISLTIKKNKNINYKYDSKINSGRLMKIINYFPIPDFILNTIMLNLFDIILICEDKKQ